MSSLKLQLGLTLALLITLSMFLFGLVTLTFWQRSAMERETELLTSTLHLAATTLRIDKSTRKPAPLPSALKKYLHKSNILCIQYQNDKAENTLVYGKCPQKSTLAAFLRKNTYAEDKVTFSGMQWNGFFFTKKYLLLTSPIQEKDGSLGSIGLTADLKDVRDPIKSIQKVFYGYLFINVLIFVTIGFFRLIHLVIRPIQRLAQLADSRTDKSDTTFLTGERWGEFTQLSLSLNRLVMRIDGDKQQLQKTVQSLKQANDELQKSRDEMIRAEKLASIGRLSAGLAHEIGNPLGIIQGYIDLLADDSLQEKERKTFSTKAVYELDRINTLIRNLLDLSRTQASGTITLIDVHQLLKNSLGAVQVRKTLVKVHYKTNLTAQISTVSVDSNGLRQVFLNCLFNSIDAIEEKIDTDYGEIVITSANNTDKSKLIITIADNGDGVEEKHLDFIFDPFFTTKEVGKGTGLGLAVAHNMIKSSGGSLQFSSSPGVGSSIIITLPVAVQKPKNH